MSAIELVRDELTLSAPRVSRMMRMTALVALIIVVSMALRVPEVALSAYMVFFIAQRDVATTILVALGGMFGVTVAIVLCFVLLSVSLGDPGLRLPLMIVLAFGGLYLMRATPAGAIGLLLGFVLFYGPTFADEYPAPEALVRALLWLWVVLAYPIALLVLGDLVFGSRPADLYRGGLGERLTAAAEFLAADAQRARETRARLERYVRLGASDLLPYVPHAGPAAAAPLRATLLRQIELLGLLARELPDSVRGDPAAQPALARAAAACAHARDALAGRRNAVDEHLELLASERRDVAAMAPATRAVVLPLVNCLQTIVVCVRELVRAPVDERAPLLHKPPSPTPADPTEAVRFALKVTLAATTGYLLYSGLEWYSIHTATITCFFVALDSVGATIHKLTLRLLGAVVGATLGMLAIVFVLPAFESVGGLVVLTAVVTLLAAWVATGSERISYAGFQIALTFYLTVLQGFSRGSKLYIGRDRVIGILIGNILMSIVFSSLWPVRAAPAQRRALALAVDALATMLRSAPEDRAALDRAEADFYTQATTARQYSLLVRFERTPSPRALFTTVVQGLFIPIHAIVRTPVPATMSRDARAALAHATARLANWLHELSTSIAADAAPPPEPVATPPLSTLEPGDHRQWLELVYAQCRELSALRST